MKTRIQKKENVCKQAERLLQQGDYWRICCVAQEYQTDDLKHVFFFQTLLKHCKSKQDAKMIHYALTKYLPDYTPIFIYYILCKDANNLNKFGFCQKSQQVYDIARKYKVPWGYKRVKK